MWFKGVRKVFKTTAVIDGGFKNGVKFLGVGEGFGADRRLVVVF